MDMYDSDKSKLGMCSFDNISAPYDVLGTLRNSYIAVLGSNLKSKGVQKGKHFRSFIRWRATE